MSVISETLSKFDESHAVESQLQVPHVFPLHVSQRSYSCSDDKELPINLSSFGWHYNSIKGNSVLTSARWYALSISAIEQDAWLQVTNDSRTAENADEKDVQGIDHLESGIKRKEIECIKVSRMVGSCPAAGVEGLPTTPTTTGSTVSLC